MGRFPVRRFWATVLCLAVGAGAARAQDEEKGYVAKAPGVASGEELTSQSQLWVMEVRFKPMRMLYVDVTNPRTGRKERQLVWYLVYQAVNRPQAVRVDTSDTTPVNREDPPPGPPLFIPEFTLVTEDGDSPQAYHDIVLPEAQQAIMLRERQRLQNTVEAVAPIPEPTPADALKERRIDGVAMWRGVDASADYFRVIMTGFSNAYKVAPGPQGKPLLWRKAIVQKYWRPGDAIDPQETEIRLQGDPEWIYRPEGVAPEFLIEKAQAEEDAPAGPAGNPATPKPDNPLDGNGLPNALDGGLGALKGDDPPNPPPQEAPGKP